MRFEDTVLARRFTIICLIATIFGMSFANLVISRPAHAYKYEASNRCAFITTQICNSVK